ncbi:MAG: TetR/AcrR family transcriptional regulator [Desulfuromonadaceae bacterium]|nr:TetR/AcrR family transcriptional regulator [Desulfuromonadaceae bacterium]MDD5106474.1 TetR/AcrR family transcriptional regulator [Desulfuromonadaceae bacterium]
MPKPDKKVDIVRAALELIAENGFHGAPMALIAEQAGVGAGTIYRYFANKDVMIATLFRELEDRLNAAILDGYETGTPIRERFLHVGATVLHYFIDNPTDFRFLEQFINSPYGAAHRRDKLLGTQEGCDVFKELFEDGIAQQVMKDFPLVILFDLAFGPLLALGRDHILGFVSLDDTLIERAIEACWDGVGR